MMRAIGPPPTSRTIKVLITNKEVEALEDLIFCVLSDEESPKARELSGKLWRRIARIYDGPRLRAWKLGRRS